MILKTSSELVLLVEDDEQQRSLLRIYLEDAGYSVIEAENGQQALEVYRQNKPPRLIITDLIMPVMDGFELIKTIRKTETRYTFLTVLSSLTDRESIVKALELGADDYLLKPVWHEELKLRLESGWRLLQLESRDELIFSLAKLAEYRSEETGFHLDRVQHYTRIMTQSLVEHHPELGLTLQKAEEIASVSVLHDIGKVGIPDQILNKTAKLTEQEFELMKTHAPLGGQLLEGLYDKTGVYYLRAAYEIAMFHHERWDGKGYPQGLSGNSIPLPARVLALVDFYDALTTKRCYKEAYNHEKAKTMIVEQRGKHFDPIIVDTYLREEQQILQIKAQFDEM